MPLILRTNWSAAARISSSLAAGSTLKSVLILRHIAMHSLVARRLTMGTALGGPPRAAAASPPIASCLRALPWCSVSGPSPRKPGPGPQARLDRQHAYGKPVRDSTPDSPRPTRSDSPAHPPPPRSHGCSLPDTIPPRWAASWARGARTAARRRGRLPWPGPRRGGAGGAAYSEQWAKWAQGRRRSSSARSQCASVAAAS